MGVGFGTFFGLLGLPWGTLLLSCGLLAPGAQKGRPKSSLREAKSCPRAAQERPREAQGRPRGSQKCPRRARERPKRAPERPREAQDRPKRDQERPRQAKRAPKRDQESPRPPKRAPKRDQESKKSENRYPNETQKDQVGRHERPKGTHKRDQEKSPKRGPNPRETGDPGKKLTPPCQEESPKGNPRGQREGRSKHKAGSIVVCKVSFIFVLGFSLCRWPRTKRNVVEARELFKDVGRAVLGLPKEPQPPKKINERG